MCIRGAAKINIYEVARMHSECIGGRDQHLQGGAYTRMVYTQQISTFTKWRVVRESVYAVQINMYKVAQGVYAAETNLIKAARIHGWRIRGRYRHLQSGVYTGEWVYTQYRSTCTRWRIYAEGVYAAGINIITQRVYTHHVNVDSCRVYTLCIYTPG
ncbi:hypothetical protein BGY98DRAFT_935006 [Russula aff. rugulosa BPL654]|nr:hypothetical protein BGY98DRAFT_934990 [Russula aff. rugulosa BPL654]KAI0276541.1 hypothetical protein BGY98DRAFT_935006 [Russula aff. rugulosa BPL654]